MRDHRKLRAFELADDLVLAIYSATKTFPQDEMFGLTSQLRRASVSIASNIVEGSARNSEADFLRFLDMAFGSIREVEYQLTIASGLATPIPRQAPVWPATQTKPRAFSLGSSDRYDKRSDIPYSRLITQVSQLQSVLARNRTWSTTSAKSRAIRHTPRTWKKCEV